jgi:hypothetical protein
MEKLEHQYGADALSEALDVSQSGFAAHRGKQNGQRWKEDAELRALIARSFEQSRNTYGSPRVAARSARTGPSLWQEPGCQTYAAERPARPAEAPFSASHHRQRP